MKKKVIGLFLVMTSIIGMTGCAGNTGSDGGHSDYYISTATTCDEYYAGECYEEGEEGFNTEEYDFIKENSFVEVAKTPLSTFAADVDTGSYTLLRRCINNGSNLDNISSAIRTEEMINYFDYNVEDTDDTFGVKYELTDCPWNEDNKILIMTIQANATENIPSEGNNFVFLIDTSGSMSSADKIDMVKESFKQLTSILGENDKVSIVTYSGSSATLLEGSSDKDEICKVLDSLKTNGGTNGSGGITAAYECAMNNFIEGGNNRVIIASDGDMNLGITSKGGLVDLISEKKESGVFLTVLGYGSGNYSDSNMEGIADAGNGNYYYIDCIEEAERVLCEKLMETTVTVAKDVKMQVEFNPYIVKEYRQIGYENRQMSASDFDDDTKDGGEVGAYQQVTVAYELIMNDGEDEVDGGLKYQEGELTEAAYTGECCTVSVRYKNPDEDESTELEFVITEKDVEDEEYVDFVCAVIETSMVIRKSDYVGSATIDSALELAKAGCGSDKYKEGFVDLLKLIK